MGDQSDISKAAAVASFVFRTPAGLSVDINTLYTLIGNATGVYAGWAASEAYLSIFRTKTKTPDIPSATNGHLQNVSSSKLPIPIIYGKLRVGGNIVYLGTTGSNNDLLHLIVILCEGEIEGVEQVDGDDQIWLNDELIDTFGDSASYEIFTGTDSQNVCGLSSFDATWTDTLRHTAYLYVRLKFDRSKFTDIPVVNVLVKGKKLFDPRTDLTIYSDNGVLALRDFMTDIRYGVGLPESSLDDDTFETAATWVEENDYTFNGILLTVQNGVDYIENILINFRGILFYSQNEFKVLIADYDTPVASINEDDIIDNDFGFEMVSARDVPNRIRCAFIDAANNYQEIESVFEVSTLQGSGTAAEESQASLIGTTNFNQMQRLASYLLERTIFRNTFTFSARLSNVKLEPGDMIQVTHSDPQWVNQIVRVVSTSFSGDGIVSLGVMEEDPAIYNEIFDLTEHTQFTPTLPDPLLQPPAVINITTTDISYTQGDRTLWSVKINFDVVSTYTYFDHVDVWQSSNNVNWSVLGKATDSLIIDPVKYNQTVYIKLVAVSTYGVKETFAGAPVVAHVVGTGLAVPGNVTNFRVSVSVNTVNYTWGAVDSDQGNKYYEIRVGSSWDTAFFIAKTKGLSYSLGSVKPGVHTFLIKAVSVDNQYSASAVSGSINVPLPAGYSLDNSDVDDFTTGTHSNTEIFTHGTYGDVLRVDHTDDQILNGGFETGDFTNWTQNDAVIEAVIVFKGSYSCEVEAVGSNLYGANSDAIVVDDTKKFKVSCEYNITAISAGSYRIAIFYYSDAAGTVFISLDDLVLDSSTTSGWESVNKTIGPSSLSPDFNFPANTESIRISQIWAGANPVGVGYMDNIVVGLLPNTILEGDYTGPKYTRGSIATSLHYLEFTPVFDGSGTDWTDLFGVGELWTDNIDSGTTWAQLLAGVVGFADIDVVLLYSEDDITYYESHMFYILSAEVSAKYKKVKIYLKDSSQTSYVMLDQDMTLKEYS